MSEETEEAKKEAFFYVAPPTFSPPYHEPQWRLVCGQCKKQKCECEPDPFVVGGVNVAGLVLILSIAFAALLAMLVAVAFLSSMGR